MRLFFLFSLLFFANLLVGQTGRITLTVVSSATSNPLPNVSATILEKQNTLVTDQNGKVFFRKLDEGKFTIKCVVKGYIEKIVDEVIIKKDEEVFLTISLDIQKKVQANDTDIKVVAQRTNAVRETNTSLISAQAKSASVLDFISGQDIKNRPIKTVADAIRMGSGTSIQDDRFAVIRGLNDRYNAAFINGTPLPSTESDRKAFAFDIFPAAIVDNLIIYKTATPDKTGDFAGGVIDITTKSTTSQNFTTIGFSTGYNSLLTGNNRFYSENKSNTDFLGLDNKLRAIPNSIPATLSSGVTALQKVEALKAFSNFKWGILQKQALPNFSFQFAKGLNVRRKEKEFFGAIFGLNYNKSYSLSQGNRDAFSSDRAIQFVQLNDSVYNDETVIAALANFSIKLNGKNAISFKNNFSVNTDNKLIKRRYTPDVQGDPNAGYRDVVRSFTSNQILSSQLTGEHLIGKQKTKLNWVGAITKVVRDVPNTSRTSYQVDPAMESVGSAFINGIGNQIAGSGTMFFIKSNETIKSFKLEVAQPYALLKNPQILKIGAGYQLRDRKFTSRLLSIGQYVAPGVNFDFSLFSLPEDKIFLANNFGKLSSGKGGFSLAEGANPNANYDAGSTTAHAFIMNDQRFFKNLRLIYGVRFEQFNQNFESPSFINSTLPPLKVDSTTNDILPSLNIIYSLTKKMNVRLSYSETVNRPEFRELAAYVFYDYQQQYSINGDLTIQRAKIKNYDFRYEFFPGKAQLFSISAFYKEFKNPIEVFAVPIFFPLSQVFYSNATSATLKGAEVEFRSAISTLLGIKKEKAFLSKFMIAANASIMESNVSIINKVSNFNPEQFINNTPIQGQSPYVINGSLSFNDEKFGFSATASVNRVGDRIMVKGTADPSTTIPNLLEKARTVFDFQIAKLFLNKKLEIKFNAKDLLSQDLIWFYDVDNNNKYTKNKDGQFSIYKAPKILTLGVTFKF